MANESDKKDRLLDEVLTENGEKQDLSLPALPSKPFDYVNDDGVRDILVGQEGEIHRLLRNTQALEDGRIQDNLKVTELKEMATVDSLTALRNKRAFKEAFPASIERAQRNVPNLAFLMFDLDKFKSVNDTYGHPAGDAVLKQFAALLQETCRKSEQPFRWGGEEFVVISDSEDIEAAMGFAERVRKAIEKHEFKLPNGETIKVTTSVGLTSMRHFNGSVTTETAGMLMEKADEALYEAKGMGRNVSVVALKDGSYKKADEVIESEQTQEQ
ncbi:GGDEF domain-containing protein [Candidatus Peregrinibacteria bacterium]|jgi:diguanylate cyclase (GGDEF)-like protein|nr:GGDEF domain-containing protein [Candidatus Peregrinibacteria bacterium]MBT4148174.1 GGDEF domain-containing protein [Candidatus Peregrinibacteria bacterium]MBT4365885.1 GGDEF domain-containing protein [Candidatus Peregrinibacteria bacterium]MBT4455648.1 GGDEF domain-containing protein [Candidatus Peregrinibacteria bacterium]